MVTELAVYMNFGPAKALPWAQGLAELCISDRHKEYLADSTGLIDCLCRALGSPEDDSDMIDEYAEKLRGVSCMTLAQLAASPSTAPLLEGHAVVNKIERLYAMVLGLQKARPAKDLVQIRLHIETVLAAVHFIGPARSYALEADSRQGRHAVAAHVMLSYEWSVQSTIIRLNGSLKQRGYRTWLDVDEMAGSTIDSMSDAVDRAAAILYTVCQPYKESANCRLEANYGHAAKVDMIPLKTEAGYRPRGWLGMLMGTRLYYGFYGAVLDDTAAFEAKVDELCHEIGDRGKLASAAEHPTSASMMAQRLRTISSPQLSNLVVPVHEPTAAGIERRTERTNRGAGGVDLDAALAAIGEGAGAAQSGARGNLQRCGTGSSGVGAPYLLPGAVQPPAATLPPPVRAQSYALPDTAVATTRRSSDLLARPPRGGLGCCGARRDRAVPGPEELRRADVPALAALQRRLERLLAAELISEEELCAAEDIIAASVCASRRAESVAHLSAIFPRDATFARRLRLVGLRYGDAGVT
jgi:hypothetical protein